MEIAITIGALAIAIWQLKLQRDEIRLNGRINSLIHIAALLKDKIDHHEQIIQNLKTKKQEWSGHAARVNNELRPLLANVNSHLMTCISHQTASLDMEGIRKALRLSDGEVHSQGAVASDQPNG